MLRNGIRSAGTKSRHIDIRFFWVSDRLKQEKMSLEYCPTERMLGNFLKAKMTDFVLIRVTGPAVDALLSVNQNKYAPFVMLYYR